MVSRIYGEPVQVWIRDTRPTRFVWRSRLYTVTARLDHWTTAAPETATPPEGRAPGEDDAGGEDMPRREFWRVEALAGLGSAPAVYELRHDLRSGAWHLSRAWD